MIQFPEADSEIEQLELFLATAEVQPQTEHLAELQELASFHLSRLRGFISIGFAGETGSGKSSLVNLLAGAEILPTDQSQPQLSLVALNYAEEPETIAGWWANEFNAYTGIDLQKAASDNPDFISVGLDSAALQHVSLFDLPSLHDTDKSREQTLELLNYVECVFWCTKGNAPWRASEQTFWSLVPEDLRVQSVMVVTHADAPELDGKPQHAVTRLMMENKALFQKVVSISTPQAVAAISQEPAPDYETRPCFPS